jgi:hypothetical protein
MQVNFVRFSFASPKKLNQMNKNDTLTCPLTKGPDKRWTPGRTLAHTNVAALAAGEISPA